MSKKYKVHKYFDLDDLTLEEPCTCSSPKNITTSIFSRMENATEKEINLLDSYNSSMGGIIFSDEDVEWKLLKKSQCET